MPELHASDLADLIAERDLLGEACDRLTDALREVDTAAGMYRTEADIMRAQVTHLLSRWRMTWHALRLSRRALDASPQDCGSHGREWRGDCAACEQARLVRRALVALRATDQPMPDPPIPLPQ